MTRMHINPKLQSCGREKTAESHLTAVNMCNEFEARPNEGHPASRR